jgi:hypothetical protein
VETGSRRVEKFGCMGHVAGSRGLHQENVDCVEGVAA